MHGRSLAFRYLAVVTFVLGAVTVLGAQRQEETLKNQNIVDMTKAGIADAVIVKLIETSRTDFDTSPAALVALKTSGVSGRVVDAIVSTRNPKPAAPFNTVYSRPEEVGIYVNEGEQLLPLKVEIISWRSGGVLKKALGSRGHLNGQVMKPVSALRLDSSQEFIVYCPEGVVAEEYQLLRFWEKRDRREFRLLTGGVVHESSGADMNAVPFDVERFGTRLYRVKPALPLAKGEYGFLPPGAMASASTASAGKMYTFGVTGAR